MTVIDPRDKEIKVPSYQDIETGSEMSYVFQLFWQITLEKKIGGGLQQA